MDWVMKILGFLISLAFLFVGLRFVIFPRKSVQNIQRIKYKTTAEPRKAEMTISIIFGVLLSLIGVYYLTIVILSIIYPA